MENREPFPSFQSSRFDPTECGFPCELLRVQRVISKWNWSIVLIAQFPPLISPNSQGTFHSVHDLSCLLSARIAFAMVRTFEHEFVPTKNTYREITVCCRTHSREMEDREGESAYLFLMLTGGHVCGWRVACNQCARRV